MRIPYFIQDSPTTQAAWYTLSQTPSLTLFIPPPRRPLCSSVSTVSHSPYNVDRRRSSQETAASRPLHIDYGSPENGTVLKCRHGAADTVPYTVSRSVHRQLPSDSFFSAPRDFATLIFRERLNYRFCRRRRSNRCNSRASRLASAPPLPRPVLLLLVSQVVDRPVYSSCTLQFIHSSVNQSTSPQQAFLVRRRAAARSTSRAIAFILRPDADSAYM